VFADTEACPGSSITPATGVLEGGDDVVLQNGDAPDGLQPSFAV